MIVLSSVAFTTTAGSITDGQWSVEGLYSHQFSVGIFVFLMISILVFTIIVIKFMVSGSGSDAIVGSNPKRLKTGEKVMFFCIFMGIAGAVVIAAMQLLQGYLL